MLLQAITDLQEMHKAKHYCAFLSGHVTSDIKSYKHDLMPNFGIGKERDEYFWNAVIRQVIVSGMISKDIETYGTLKLTEKGIEFLSNPISFSLIKEHDFSNTDDEDGAINISGKGGAFQLGRAGEEIRIGRVRARPAAFDIVDAQGIQFRRDAVLVVHRKVHALSLGAITQCGVE